MSGHVPIFPEATPELAEQRNRLAPGPAEAFRAFNRSVFAEGAMPVKTKQLIAVAVAHVTQCPYCIRGHTSARLAAGGNGGRNHGSHLGRGGNARGRRLRVLGFGAGYHRAHPRRTRKWRGRMSIRIAINGLGRIGRAILKLAIDEPALELVAINDLADVENLNYLLRFDTVYGATRSPWTQDPRSKREVQEGRWPHDEARVSRELRQLSVIVSGRKSPVIKVI